MELLDSRRLRHFLAVYDLRSIGQAAEKLYVTQPALSKSIRLLEQDLKVKLFDRTPLGVVPTVFGELLAQHAKVIRSEMRHAELELSNMRGAVKGHVSVGVGPSIAANLLPTATQRLREQRPGIRLTVIEGLVDNLIPALRRGELDLAIGGWPRVADSDLTAEVLTHDSTCVVCAPWHPLAGRDRVELGDLLEFPWALPPETQRWRQFLEETFLGQGLSPPTPVVVSNSAVYIRTSLLSGNFLSYLPMQILPPQTPAPHLLALPCEALTRRIEVSVTYRERAVLSPAAQAILACVREVLDGANGEPKSVLKAALRSPTRESAIQAEEVSA
ncbi:MAG TPA: LysR family transcriptional regulator [Steroidobacteraceae bacterium]|nr:LysR family transcriptional regulator [Steroidobacteraceae bacterium]